ncbi:hypothetical protein ACX0HA_09035 [Flavobacterium hauense]
MKKLLIAALLLCAPIAYCQTVNDVPIKDIKVEYVQIVGTSKMMSTKLNIQLDFGQKTGFFSGGKEQLVKDASGNKLEFNSMIDALNFMGENGYEFISAYAAEFSGQNVYHYLLRKKQ